MRTVDDSTRPDEATENDELLRRPCAGGCGATVERLIPKGTNAIAAKLMRAMAFMCDDCIDREKAREEREEHLRIRRLHEGSCGLDRELRGLTWGSYQTHRKGALGAVRAAQAWAAGEHEKPGLLLVGSYGVGKTRLAATACWAMLDRRPCAFVNVADLIARMGAGFGDKDREAALRVLTGRGALVLDDVDKLAPSLAVLSQLYTAIDGRVRSGAPLLVTTNLTPSRLLERLARPGRGEDEDQRRTMAEAIHDRLLGHCTVHGIEGESGRRRS
jgi:DNA replication protein DnaC